jgi:hypothetical protein
MRKALFLVNIDNYAPKIRELTYPLFRFYAKKIGAELVEIEERKFPEWPIVYEKLQIYELANRMELDWAIYFDSDCLVHPDCIDFTNFLPDDTCLHNAQDFANIRFRYDEFLRADGRNIGTCGWFVVAPKKCFQLWEPIDKPLEWVLDQCSAVEMEINNGLGNRDHYVEDYTISRNIAKYHLKHDTVREMLPRIGAPPNGFFWHQYTIPDDEKVRLMRDMLWQWKIPHPALARDWKFMFEGN